MTIDVARAQAETPGCAHVLHFNNAGASLQPTPVINAVCDHLEREAMGGGYEAAEEAFPTIERAYDSVAAMLGCGRDEVAMVENATRGWDMAFYAQTFRPGDRILTGRSEYASNVIALLQVARRTGAQVEVVPDDEHGQISLDALKHMLDDKVRLIALTHVPTNGGLVNPAVAVGAVARDAGVPFLLDACQSVGQMPVRVDEIGCAMLSATGRKFLRAPRGTGFLYVRREWIEKLDPPFLDLRAATWTSPNAYEIRNDARRFENWESHVAGRIGLGAAVEYALGWGLESISLRVTELAELLRAELGALAGVVVHDKGLIRCGIVTFIKESEDSVSLHRRLRALKINTSVSSPEYARFDMEGRGLGDLLRASVHYYNTEDDVLRFCSAVAGS
jgi:selenocysteine lyase/cysteine desulfurase